MTWRRLALAAAILAVGATAWRFAGTASGQADRPIARPPVKWEYRVLTPLDSTPPHLDPKRLDQLGEEGWELAGVVPVT